MKKLIALLLFIPTICFAQAYSPVGSMGIPTVSSCGVAGASVDGTDQSGVITLGTVLVSSCILNFSHTLEDTPNCILTSNSVTSIAVLTARTTASVTIGLTVSLPGGKVYYFCPMK